MLSLLTASDIQGVGIDPVDTADYLNYHILLEHGCVIVENLIHLDQLPATCQFCTLPLLYFWADGALVRAVALLEENT